jgi:hypothetical protein
MDKSYHMCGLPSWSVTGGITTRLRVKASYGQKSDRWHTVWCCSNDCAIQSHAVAEMGPATRHWPVTLAEYAALNRDRILGSDRTETIAEPRENSGSAEAKNEIVDPEVNPGVSVRQKRPGGRPRKWQSEAARLRAYRREAASA